MAKPAVFENMFCDVHVHAMNLSHPNLIAFLKRTNLKCYMNLLFLPFIGGWLARKNYTEVMNLISVMENNIGEFFLIMEEEYIKLQTDGKLHIKGKRFQKIIITPLVMDFGDKGLGQCENIYYKKMARKPVVYQVVDLLTGIRTYLQKSDHKLLEIFPFLGINTRNYEFGNEANPQSDNTIPKMFEKYFGSVAKEPPLKRYQKLKSRMGLFDGNIDDESFDYNYLFAGVKIYPPLGFDPWPDNETERRKVEYVYSICEKKALPITMHCGGPGFTTVKKSKAYKLMELDKWDLIMSQYPELKVSFAHFGDYKKVKNRTRHIMALAKRYPGVYTDLSYLCFNEGDYKKMNKRIKRAARNNPCDVDLLKSRIVFGTDFMINLMKIRSYKQYILDFIEDRIFTDDEKIAFCNDNALKFVFGNW